MNSILHKITIETTPEKLYHAITTQNGLSAWWTKCETSSKIDSVASFLFGPNGEHKVEMKIKRLTPNEEVQWQCVNGPWAETGLFTFSISPDKRGAVLRFAHADWPDTGDFYQHCNTKWAFFLCVSLKKYLESGTGEPHPQDPNI